MLTEQQATILRDGFSEVISKFWNYYEETLPEELKGLPSGSPEKEKLYNKAVSFNNYLCEQRDAINLNMALAREQDIGEVGVLTESVNTPHPPRNDVFDAWGNYQTLFQSKNVVSLYKNIMGEFLTLIDATFPDKEQREAQKSIVRRMLSQHKETLLKWVFDTRLNGTEFKPTATFSGQTFPF